MLNTPINRLERFSLCAHTCFSQNIIIFSIDYLKDENGLPSPKKGGNFKLFDINPSPVIDNWKILIIRKIMTLRKGFCNIPGQNGDLSKLTSCQTTFERLPWWAEIVYTPVYCTFLFILPCHLK